MTRGEACAAGALRRVEAAAHADSGQEAPMSQEPGRRRKPRARPAAERLEGRRVPAPVGPELTDGTLAAIVAHHDAAHAPAEAAPESAVLTAQSAESASPQGAEPLTSRIRDGEAPRVVEAQMLTRGDQVVGFAIRFSEPMDPGPTQDTRNYRVMRVTQPNKYLARLLYQSDGPRTENVALRSATYVAGDDLVVLMLRDPRKATGNYRIGLSNPHQRRPPRLAEVAPPALVDFSGTPLAAPRGPRGHVRPGPIMIQPLSRLRLELLVPDGGESAK
jgi:hypothetical protein